MFIFVLQMGRDKNAPKGHMTAYSCFVQVIREEHKKKHPQETVVLAEFSKKCGEKWRVSVHAILCLKYVVRTISEFGCY